MGSGSIFVVSDAHLGLMPKLGERRKGVASEPEKLGQFLNLLIRLENGEKIKVKIGSGRKEKVLKPPEKLIMTGDILELWDATDRTVDYCSQPIFDLLEDLRCEKIYLLGNHDYDLSPMIGDYPSGDSEMRIIEDYYPIQREGEKDKKLLTLSMGDREYLFLHGHQFDRLFGVDLFKVMPHIRSGALAFGRYGDIFIALLVLGLACFAFVNMFPAYFPLDYINLFLTTSWFNPLFSAASTLGNPVWIILWAILGIPRLFYLYGRKAWNKLRNTRYDRKGSIKGILKWWGKNSKKVSKGDKNLRIVYGHTHLIDAALPEDLSEINKGKRVDITTLNVPAWVIDRSVKYRQELRATCLYIDDEDELFLAWDWSEKKPFFVPMDAVVERRKNGNISKKTAKNLEEINWPKAMLKEWMGESEK